MPAQSPLRDRLGPGDGLIETLGYLPGKGVARVERHLARMARSAIAFAIPFDSERACALLDEQAHGDHPLRLRILLDTAGTIAITAAPFVAVSPDSIWRIGIAEVRLSSTDPLLAHKTTRRAIYEAARAEFGPETDEVPLLNERGELCEGTITSLFLDRGDGKLLTPPLSSGLLAGILRQELLENGAATEAVLRPADVHNAAAIYVGNSLRGLIRASR